MSRSLWGACGTSCVFLPFCLLSARRTNADLPMTCLGARACSPGLWKTMAPEPSPSPLSAEGLGPDTRKAGLIAISILQRSRRYHRWVSCSIDFKARGHDRSLALHPSRGVSWSPAMRWSTRCCYHAFEGEPRNVPPEAQASDIVEPRALRHMQVAVVGRSDICVGSVHWPSVSHQHPIFPPFFASRGP